MRTRVWICAIGLLCAGTGFAWPGASERLVTRLTSAESPREKRDALRLVRALVLARESEGALLLAHEPEGTLGHGQDQREDQPSEGEQAALRAAVEPLTHDSQPEVRIDARHALEALQPEASTWLSAQDDLDPRVRSAAAEALGRRLPLAPLALEALLRAASDPEGTVRLSALRALSGSDDPRALRQLLTALRDPALALRIEVVRRLGGKRGAEVLSALLSAADADLPELRVAAIEALGGWQGAQAEAAVGRALADDDSAVVLAALRARSAHGERAPLAQLEALSHSPSPQLASAAAGLLRRHERAPAQAANAEPWLAPLIETATPGLTLTESLALLEQLERLLPRGTALATDPLLAWLGRAPPALRTRIAQLLERAGGPLSVQAVRRFPQTTEPAQRAAYIRLFAQAPADAERDLLPLLDDPAPQVREAAVLTLARSLHAPTWSALLRQLEHTRGPRRSALLRTLALGLARPVRIAGFPSQRERELMSTSLSDDLDGVDDVAAALALQVLGALEDEAARALVRAALDDPRSGRRIAALRASVVDPSAAARAKRQALLRHGDARIVATAVVALALAEDPLPLTWLLSQIDTASWPIGPAAAFALSYGAQQPGPSWRALALCPLLASKEPISRRNVAWMIRSRESDSCRAQAIAILAMNLEAPVDAAPAQPVLPRAVVLQDARLIVSWPDAAGRLDWPRIVAVGHVNAWLGPYAPP